MREAIKTNLAGLSICLGIAIFIGVFWPYPMDSVELITRTSVSYSGVVLATVSGAAAVLSLTKGISSVMVGVMVAVALLPPATSFGLFLGARDYASAYGAFLLLAVNIVCINLAAHTTLLWKGVRPRTWYQQKTAKYKLVRHFLFWGLTLILLLIIMYL